jgi:ubiquinone/menaquinone biosynthesis C-methylase UbiE
MFTQSAAFYDLIYSWKNYRQEVDRLLGIIRARVPEAKTILDVACGTGEHLRYLPDFDRTGVDLDPKLLWVARKKLPDVAFILADMRAFDLNKQFDVAVCLFSAIGYVRTIEKLDAAVSSMAKHVSPGGILCIEPWFTPEQWSHRKHPSMTTAEAGDFKVCRIFAGGQSGKISTNTLHYLVADGDKVDYFTERHDLGLFTEDEMRAAFEAVGLTVHFDPVGLENRGLYIGTKRSV